MNVYHITHNDADAIGCALVVQLVHGFHFKNSVETYFCAIGDVPNNKATEIIEKVENGEECELIISDISVTKEIGEKLVKLNEEYDNFNFYGFDHHPTNPNKKFQEFHVYEKNKEGIPVSASHLMYIAYRDEIEDILQESFSSEKIQICLDILIDNISRYDTWLWKTSPRKDCVFCGNSLTKLKNEYGLPVEKMNFREDLIAAMISIYGIDTVFNDLTRFYEHAIECPDYIMDYVPDHYNSTFVAYYNLCEKQKKDTLYKVSFYRRGEYIIASFIGDGLLNTSDVANEIYQKYEYVDIVYILYVSNNSVGFRTCKETIDLSRYSHRIFGGGGHRKASGAKLSTGEFMELLSCHWTGLTLTNGDDTEIKNALLS